VPAHWQLQLSNGFFPHEGRARTFSELSNAHAKGPKKPPPPSLFTACVAASVAACTPAAAFVAAPPSEAAASDAACDGSLASEDSACSSSEPSIASRAAKWSSAEGAPPALRAAANPGAGGQGRGAVA